jgi:hypothetical protein
MTVAARHATLEDTSPGGVPPRVRARRWWRQHTRWINRLSTAKYAALVVVIGAATGPAIGVCFEDQLRPPLDPYLSPLRTYLGIAPVDKPLLVPYVPIDQFPDPPGDPVAMTPPAALPPVPVAPRAAARRAAPAPAAPVAAPRQARAGARQGGGPRLRRRHRRPRPRPPRRRSRPMNPRRLRTRRRRPELSPTPPPPPRPAPPDLGGRRVRRAAGHRTPQQPPIRQPRRTPRPTLAAMFSRFNPLPAAPPPRRRSTSRPTRRDVLAGARATYPDRELTRHHPLVAMEYQRAMQAWRASGGGR